MAHPALGCSRVPLAPALVAQLHGDVWYGKAVLSALSGAQPSQKAVPQPREDRKHLSCSSQEGQASVVWCKMVFMPCRNVHGELPVPSPWRLRHICIALGNLYPLQMEPEVGAGHSLL